MDVSVSPGRREIRHAYGFDDVAIVPGSVTVDPGDADVSWDLAGYVLGTPVLASAMDAVVDTAFGVELGRRGGLAVLNLEGVQTRYENPGDVLREISEAEPTVVTSLMQDRYHAPIREELIGQRIAELKAAGVLAAVSVTPLRAERFAQLAVEAGADIVVVQSTVSTARFRSSGFQLSFERLCRLTPAPVVVGNCVSFQAATELMETGISGLLVGVGPGAACTSREVLGIGVPQVTATLDCAAARDAFQARTGRYVPIITDGGMRTGGDVCKAFVAGADAVMLGSPFAQCVEAPGRGFHWGMATPHDALPRGTRIRVGVKSTIEKTLFGPTSRTDGTENLIGALKSCMGVCGAANIQEMHQAELVIAPSIKTEGKVWQLSGAR
ncbi:MAG: GuaB3 family IMP dehydrogenase-related protein [Chloroflexi bacterium]|nr:GuaB3 family IMP dehydrogenase-related protein [Chloroflexota bacterium]